MGSRPLVENKQCRFFQVDIGVSASKLFHLQSAEVNGIENTRPEISGGAPAWELGLE